MQKEAPGRTFQNVVQARANKVSLALAHARSIRRFFFLFFFFFHFSKPLVGPALCLWGSLSSSGCSVSGPALFNVTHTVTLSFPGFYYELFTLLRFLFFCHIHKPDPSLSLTAITQSDYDSPRLNKHSFEYQTNMVIMLLMSLYNYLFPLCVTSDSGILA